MTTFEPLPAPTARRGAPRTRVLADLVADLRAKPGEWARVGEYATAPSARTTASLIRRGELAMFRPAGAFEAEHRSIRGTHTVWARYVDEGAPAGADTPAPVPQLSATERSFLKFALELAADAMAADASGFTDDDDAALAALRKLTDRQQPHTPNRPCKEPTR